MTMPHCAGLGVLPLVEADDVDLIARIYDTALDPAIWPELMLRIAHKLGARGAFIFELRLDQERPQIASRIFSSNYIPEIVRSYLIEFNDLEIADQGRFAELSRADNAVDLVSDIHLKNSLADLLAQPNTAFMMKHGLKHRAGALLNKDLVNVDRFALQYSLDHGPITEAERRKAAVFLPHIAKVIGLARPLEEQLLAKGIFEDMLRDANQGIAVLGPRGTVLYANVEFERVLSAYPVFRKAQNGVLEILEKGWGGETAGRFRSMIESGDAHGQYGARARKEALIVDLPSARGSLFIEICPVEESRQTGRLGAGCRLLTVIDTSRPVRHEISRLKTFYKLSPSECEILELIARGHTNAEMSDLRGRSPDTIKSQMKALMRKTNSETRTDLVHMIYSLSSVVGYQAEP